MASPEITTSQSVRGSPPVHPTQPSGLLSRALDSRFSANRSIPDAAEDALRALIPNCSPTVLGRLRREHIRSAADLVRLDKDDLRELGLTMMERSKVLAWQMEAKLARSRSWSMEEVCPGTPGAGAESRLRLDVKLSFPWQANAEASEDGLLDERAEFWCNLVSKASPFDLTGEVERANLSDIRENVLEERFDVTSERVQEVYEAIDRDADGRISVAELGEGLARCGLHGLDSLVAQVWEMISSKRNDCISFVEFEAVLTRLKLAQLCMGPLMTLEDACIHLIDYNSRDPLKLPLEKKNQGHELRDYFFGHRKTLQEGCEEPTVRWVHVDSFSVAILLALTVKYQLHPLGVEDVIEQCNARMDRFSGHYFAAIEQLCVSPCSMSGKEAVEVQGFHVALFVGGPPHWDTMVTLSQKDRSFAEDWPHGPSIGKRSRTELSCGWVSKLRKRLSASRSRVRERRSDFLMFNVIDLCSDELVNVTIAYRARIDHLDQQLHTKGAGVRTDWWQEVSAIRLQLAVVSRRLRGVQRLLRHISEDADLSLSLSGYLEDVVDHLIEAQDDVGHLTERTQALTASYELALDKARALEEREQERKNRMEREEARKRQREQERMQNLQDERMNKTLFLLTVATFIFAPVQFMAGVYGMNFQGEDGKPSIPELVQHNGYVAFWIGVVVYLVVSFSIAMYCFRAMKRGSKEEIMKRPSMSFEYNRLTDE